MQAGARARSGRPAGASAPGCGRWCSRPPEPGVPVIDGVVVALKMADGLVEDGLSTSTRADCATAPRLPGERRVA